MSLLESFENMWHVLGSFDLRSFGIEVFAILCNHVNIWIRVNSYEIMYNHLISFEEIGINWNHCKFFEMIWNELRGVEMCLSSFSLFERWSHVKSFEIIWDPVKSLEICWNDLKHLYLQKKGILCTSAKLSVLAQVCSIYSTINLLFICWRRGW